MNWFCFAAMYGREGAVAGRAERHAGVARPTQNSHQADPAGPRDPGHRDNHHGLRLPAVPAVDQTHQHSLPPAPEPEPQPNPRLVHHHHAPPTIRFYSEEAQKRQQMKTYKR